MTFFHDEPSAELFLGLLDTVFLFSYAIGMFFTSALADRVEIRLMVSIGMWISGVLLFLFGVLPDWIDFYNKAFYAVLWSLQGIVQSVGWPCCVATLGNWFGSSRRGILFGFWGSCASMGNIIGNAIAGGLLFYGYNYAFLTVTLMMIGGGVVTFFGFVNSPLEIGLPEPTEKSVSLIPRVIDVDSSVEQENTTEEISDSTSSEDLVEDPSHNEVNALSFTSALCLPGVIPYSLSYACLKFVNYAFLFWLPFYLVNNFDFTDSFASSISTWYDVGGIVGGICCGLVSDLLGNRSSVMFVMLMISPFALWGYKESPPSAVANCLLMSVAGFFVNGVANLLSTAIAVDLAKQKAVRGNKKALATVTGIIDATGSLGAAVGQYGVAAMQATYGWGWVFNLFIIANVAANLLLIPVLYRDFKKHFVKCLAMLNRLRTGPTYSPLEVNGS